MQVNHCCNDKPSLDHGTTRKAFDSFIWNHIKIVHVAIQTVLHNLIVQSSQKKKLIVQLLYDLYRSCGSNHFSGSSFMDQTARIMWSLQSRVNELYIEHLYVK